MGGYVQYKMSLFEFCTTGLVQMCRKQKKDVSGTAGHYVVVRKCVEKVPGLWREQGKWWNCRTLRSGEEMCCEGTRFMERTGEMVELQKIT